MRNLSASDKYGIAASLGLLLMVMFNSALLMLIVSILGLIAGLWVLRQGDARRVAFIAFAAFAIAAVFAIVGLVRAG